MKTSVIILLIGLIFDCEALLRENTRRIRGKRSVRGQWSSWSNSGVCTATCGGGEQIQRRQCNSRDGRWDVSLYCYGTTYRKLSCNDQACPEWSGGIFLSCSKPCGGGIQKGFQYCNGCGRVKYITRGCNTQPCSAVDGQWSAWVNTETCSKTCGGGKKKQERSCSNPAPRDGGRGCIGDSSRSKDCNSQHCPVDGQWSAWTNYKTCSKPCGGGKQQQKRVCNNPAPQNGGRDCEGGHIRLIYCNQQACKVDGKWSSWTNDGTCSKTCEVGKQKQRRTCTDPLPQNGGKVCSGPSSRVLNCNTQPCKDLPEDICETREEFRGCYQMTYYTGICQTDYTAEECLSKAFIYKDEDNKPVATIEIEGVSHVINEGQTLSKDSCTFNLRNFTLSVNETICEIVAFGN